ncbi:phosphate ABC transporter permease subunit PstC [Salinibacter altiplanensis]|uniref:phosphate ABC transporter permease subunit PstC n=1 Tax=Salinibacter altiplanensis TaxID=1803181 RepID=UPI000C9EEF32|nr:phosphate ABC transporter permease subunit PstC [Salinibacter altiplanensis]
MSTPPSPPPTTAENEATRDSRPAEDLRQQVYDSPKEQAIQYALGACALISVLTTLGIAAVLIIESLPFFQAVPLTEFFGETRWTPQFTEKYFGIWALLSGTLLVTVISAVVALPVGLASAIFVSEYAADWVRKLLKPGLELLAGVPTVVYGYFALTFVTPLLQTVVPGLGVYNALSAGVVVGIMIIPMVASLSEDALQAVPDSLARAAYALGATKYEAVVRVNVPAALGGIMASFILAVSRAIGETMIVTLAAGASPKTTLDPTAAIQTMTAFIVQVSKGDTPQGTIEYQSIFAVGLVLFLITLAMNIFANRITRRYKEKY